MARAEEAYDHAIENWSNAGYSKTLSDLREAAKISEDCVHYSEETVASMEREPLHDEGFLGMLQSKVQKAHRLWEQIKHFIGILQNALKVDPAAAMKVEHQNVEWVKDLKFIKMETIWSPDRWAQEESFNTGAYSPNIQTGSSDVIDQLEHLERGSLFY